MSGSATIQKHLKIKGRVQGVGFRYFTRQNAKDLGIKGWVKNMSDGTVEAVVSGSREQVEKMINRLHEGPVSARVSEVIELSDNEEIETFNDFSVHR